MYTVYGVTLLKFFQSLKQIKLPQISQKQETFCRAHFRLLNSSNLALSQNAIIYRVSHLENGQNRTVFVVMAPNFHKLIRRQLLQFPGIWIAVLSHEIGGLFQI